MLLPKTFWLLLNFFQAMLENFNCQSSITFSWQPRWLKIFGHLLVVKLDDWNFFDQTNGVIKNLVTDGFNHLIGCSLISTINLTIEFFKFLPKKFWSLFEKQLVTTQRFFQSPLVTTKLWWLKPIWITTIFKAMKWCNF
jgi:hypothetical protein